MAKGIQQVKIEYSTSLEKWQGIRKFAELNEIPTNKIDVMIARIEKVGDAKISRSIAFKITDFDEFLHSIYNSDGHPCPHCTKYVCCDCPLDDDDHECCKEWREVKEQLIHHNNETKSNN